MGHTHMVVSPMNKKRHDTRHPKCLACVLVEVPAGAPLLKVYAYGPFGARFFLDLHSVIFASDHDAVRTIRDRHKRDRRDAVHALSRSSDCL